MDAVTKARSIFILLNQVLELMAPFTSICENHCKKSHFFFLLNLKPLEKSLPFILAKNHPHKSICLTEASLKNVCGKIIGTSKVLPVVVFFLYMFKVKKKRK